MSRSLPRASALWTVALATTAMTALAGCEAASTAGDGAAEATPAATATSAPDTDNVDGQTGDVAPVADPAVVLTSVTYDEDSNSVSAGAFMAGVVEEDGTCRLVVHREEASVETTGPGMPTPTTTDCGDLSVELPDGADGDWEAAVTYTSAAHEATSEVRTVEIP